MTYFTTMTVSRCMKRAWEMLSKRLLARWLMVALVLFVPARLLAQTNSYDLASGILTIPSVQVGSATFVNVTLRNDANFTFRLVGATPQAVSPVVATYDLSTSILTLPTVQVGGTTYSNVTLRNVGNYSFVLVSASGPSQTPSGSTSGSASACLDTSIFATGSTSTLDYQTKGTGMVPSTNRTVTLVEGPRTFNGQSAIAEKSTSTGISGPGAGFSSTSVAYYQLQELKYLTLGAEISGSMTTVYSPPMVFDYSLSAGQSFTTTYTQTTTGVGLNSKSTSNMTVTFQGFEDVTVPAGTFAGACKWLNSISEGGTTYAWTQWTTRKGIMLKTQNEGSTTELVSGTLNGGPVGP